MSFEIRARALELAIATPGVTQTTAVEQASAYFAFLSDTPESAAPAAPASKPRGKAKAAPESSPQAATPAPAATAPAAQPAQSPAVPTPSRDAVNDATKALAGVDREAAVKILTTFGATTVRDEGGVKKTIVNTTLLKPEQYQEVIDAMEEKKAQIDAAAAQGSLV